MIIEIRIGKDVEGSFVPLFSGILTDGEKRGKTVRTINWGSGLGPGTIRIRSMNTKVYAYLTFIAIFIDEFIVS